MSDAAQGAARCRRSTIARREDGSGFLITAYPTDEVVVMKDINNRVIGFEVLHVEPGSATNELEVETFVLKAS